LPEASFASKEKVEVGAEVINVEKIRYDEPDSLVLPRYLPQEISI
jgi:hypothetical protein